MRAITSALAHLINRNNAGRYKSAGAVSTPGTLDDVLPVSSDRNSFFVAHSQCGLLLTIQLPDIRLWIARTDL